MTDPDVLVQDYLARLRRAAAGLDPERRHDLLTGITEHIDAARSSGAGQDEVGMRTVLDRLGEPAEIVAAAAGDGGPRAQDRDEGRWESPAHRSPRQRGTGLELAALVLLTAGSFVPFVGWLAGVALLWCSDRWRAGEKLLGTLVVPLGPGGVLIFGALLPFRGGAETCTTTPSTPFGSSPGPALPGGGGDVTTCTLSGPPGWVGLLLTVTLVVAAMAVPVWLYRTARRRADAEQELAPQP